MQQIKKVLILSFLTILIQIKITKAQSVSINSSGQLPNSSSILDMSDVNNKGLLIPQIALTGKNDNTSIVSPATSLIIYNTATVSDVTPGYYYFTGTEWAKLNNKEYNFQNGLTETATNEVKLGGSLTESTTINLGNKRFAFNVEAGAFFVFEFNNGGTTEDMAVFRNDGNVNFLNNVSIDDNLTITGITSANEYLNIGASSGFGGYGFRQRNDTLQYKKASTSTWTNFPDAPVGEAMWWYKPNGQNYIRPQGNPNIRVYDDTETYGLYYNGSSNQYGGYFVTSSGSSTTSAVVGFSDVAGSQTYGYLGYNGRYTDASGNLTIDGTAVYGRVEDKDRTAIFGRTSRDANTAAIIGYSDVWTAGYYYCYDNSTSSHSGLYSQLDVDVRKTNAGESQTAIKGYSEYTEGIYNDGYTVGGGFYAIGHTQDAKGVDAYASCNGDAKTYAWGIDVSAVNAETTYGIKVSAGTDGVTGDDKCWGVYSTALSSDGNAILGLGGNVSSITFSGDGDGVIGGSDAGYGVIGYHYDGTSTKSYGVLGHSVALANYFYHDEDDANGDGQASIKAVRYNTSSTASSGNSYAYGETNQAILAYNNSPETQTYSIAGHLTSGGNGRTGAVFGSDYWAWGCLGYEDSGNADYGVYATTALGGTTGKDFKNKTGVGIGSYGDLAGAWFRGNIYGTITKGERFAQYIDGKTYINDIIVKLEDNGKNERIATYVPTSMSADIYIRGTGQLSNGKANIQFDENYLDIISNKVPVIVTVTPIGETQGLHITNLKSNGFAVAENGKGKGNVQFTWIAIAVRKGYENPKNPKEVLSSDFDDKLNDFMFNENDLKNNAKPIWWDGKSIRYDAIPVKKDNHKKENINKIKQIEVKPNLKEQNSKNNLKEKSTYQY